MVWIRDARLGLLYYLALAGIVWYMICALAVDLVWLEFWSPRFIVNMALKEPVVAPCNIFVSSCQQDWSPIAQLKYCCHDTCEKKEGKRKEEGRCSCNGEKVDRYDCKYSGGLRAAEVLDSALLVKTRKTKYVQNFDPDCAGDGACAKQWKNSAIPQAYYLADLERFTLTIDHSVMQEEIGIFQAVRDMEGFLEVGSGSDMQAKLCGEWPDAVNKPYKGRKTSGTPCYIKPKRSEDHRDVFEVKTIFSAMGIDIDEGPEMDEGKSIRSQGMTVTMEIQYFNYAAWRGVLKETRYIYRLIPMPTNTFKKKEVLDLKWQNSRVVEVTNGVMISVIASGSLGKRNLMNVMSAATTVLALVTLTELVMRKLVVVMMSRRSYYYEYMYQISGDFGHIKELEKMKPEQIRDALVDRKLDTEGSQTECMYRLLENGWKPRPKGVNGRDDSEIELGRMSRKSRKDGHSSSDEDQGPPVYDDGVYGDTFKRLSKLEDTEEPISREDLAERIRDGIMFSERPTIVLQQNMSGAAGSSDMPALDAAPMDIGQDIRSAKGKKQKGGVSSYQDQAPSVKQKRLHDLSDRLAKLEANAQARKKEKGESDWQPKPRGSGGSSSDD